MRTEKEMYDLIISIAQSDERIQAVYLNGSRTNPNVPKDIFQDYDVVYVVTETKPFMLNYVVRKQLEKMLSWKVGVITDYSVSVGKSAKYMYKWLSNQEWISAVPDASRTAQGRNWHLGQAAFALHQAAPQNPLYQSADKL